MTILQILAGAFYLLNKIFLSFSERNHRKEKEQEARYWRINAWVVYLIGLPPWVILFIMNRNWIAASVEASGAPAMLLGLITATRGINTPAPKWLDRLALLCIPLGFGYSFYDFGGLNTLNQWLEVALTGSFLIGTYRLAKERRDGYLWYIAMHVSCGWLMLAQDYFWLLIQQIVSLVFIIYAYNEARKTRAS